MWEWLPAGNPWLRGGAVSILLPVLVPHLLQTFVGAAHFARVLCVQMCIGLAVFGRLCFLSVLHRSGPYNLSASSSSGFQSISDCI